MRVAPAYPCPQLLPPQTLMLLPPCYKKCVVPENCSMELQGDGRGVAAESAVRSGPHRSRGVDEWCGRLLVPAVPRVQGMSVLSSRFRPEILTTADKMFTALRHPCVGPLALGPS